MKRELLKQQLISLLHSNVEACRNMHDLQAGAKGMISHVIRKYDDIDGAEFVSEGVKTLIEEQGSSVLELLTYGHTTQSAKHAQASLLTQLIGEENTV